MCRQRGVVRCEHERDRDGQRLIRRTCSCQFGEFEEAARKKKAEAAAEWEAPEEWAVLEAWPPAALAVEWVAVVKARAMVAEVMAGDLGQVAEGRCKEAGLLQGPGEDPGGPEDLAHLLSLLLSLLLLFIVPALEGANNKKNADHETGKEVPDSLCSHLPSIFAMILW